MINKSRIFIFLALISSIILLIPMSVSFAGVCGDINGDEAVNIADAVYLINYVFKGGSEPICEEEPETVTDIDGNVYQTVMIGDQVWMAENLKVTHYRNGDPIPHVTNNSEWASTTSGYCSYNNDEANVAVYGRLYNWPAINDSRNIAPEGWHVPSDAEWKQLEIWLGMSQPEADQVEWRGTDEGGKLKEVGTTHWLLPNTGATNESNFIGLPAGYRDYSGYFNEIGRRTMYWSSTAFDDSFVWSRGLEFNKSTISRYYDGQTYGFSVRCVKD